MNKKQAQKEVVLNLLKKYGPLRTDEMNKLGLQLIPRISDSSRALRYLQDDGLVRSYHLSVNKKNSTKTWAVVEGSTKEQQLTLL